jgi:hypothetical protein
LKEIPLTKGLVALIDDEDFEKVSVFRWQAVSNKKVYYAYHSIAKKLPNGKKGSTAIKMHRLVMGVTDPKIQVDHINGNTLDNRKENLRLCSNIENSRNRKGYCTNTSGFRGVGRDKRRNSNPWFATIVKDEKQKWLGYFNTPEEAAKAFDKAAKEIYGEFCGKLNFE